jgi:hypothetical protein
VLRFLPSRPSEEPSGLPHDAHPPADVER